MIIKRNITFLVFITPIIVSYVLELIIQANMTERFRNFIEHFIVLIILVSISFLIKKIQSKKTYLKLVYALLCLMLFFETVYYYYFKTSFNPSAMFIVLETNGEEAREFLASYFDSVSIVLMVIYLAFIVVGLYMLNTYATNIKKIKPLVIFALIGVSLVILRTSKLIDYNLLYAMVKGSSVYAKEMVQFDNQNDNNSFTSVKHNHSINDNQLYVVLLGESVSRLHVQLYGKYSRETTPLLGQIKDELHVMKDVISPHTYTIASLTKSLTLGNAENPERKFDGSIIQLLNQADFKTYWISNQRPIGFSDTQVTKIASAAQETVFLNSKHTSENTPYDEVILNELQKILSDEVKRKIVFVHMIGAHKEYDKRYPSSFNYFNTSPKTKFKGVKSERIINAYDNAIRYTDSVLRSVIELVRNEKAMSYVLYLSDHGQEVYDEIDFHGQTNDQLVTKNMYEIPFFLWTSEMYRKNKHIGNNENQKYMTDDLIHTIADLSLITANEIDSTRSLFSPAFKERKRLIKDGVDYDTFFEKFRN